MSRDIVRRRLRRKIHGAELQVAFRSKMAVVKSPPCSDCGRSYPPYVMHFDHRDPTQKKFEIATGYTRSKAALEEELAKCDLVCANCHAERTHRDKYGSILAVS